MQRIQSVLFLKMRSRTDTLEYIDGCTMDACMTRRDATTTSMSKEGRQKEYFGRCPPEIPVNRLYFCMAINSPRE
jgi:hypothetical protein